MTTRICTSAVIDAPIEVVWAKVRDFNNMPQWHPKFSRSHIEGGVLSDEVGCVRNFDIAGGEIWIFCAWQPRSDVTRNLNHVFTAQCVCLLRKLRIFLRPKHDLRQAFAIAEINENYPAVIAGNIYPPGQCDLSADIALAKRITIVRAIHAMPRSTASF